MKACDVIVGKCVRFHPIIGGKHDGRKYVVRDIGSVSGRMVAWLSGKCGCVAIEALSKPEPGAGFIDPQSP